MIPPAWSSFPETGLNFTSTKPFLSEVSSLRQTGKVASPDGLRTCGWLGAEASSSTLHWGVPLPVFVAVQPGGGSPVFALSKLIVSANAPLTIKFVMRIIREEVFMFQIADAAA